MGIYLRKSVNVGPLRFNFSGSGIGVSAGIKGFRVGSGPRGNYVQIGRGALRYRTSLPSGQGSVPFTELRPRTQTGPHEALQEIESGSVLEMVDSSAAELLAELNEKRRLSRRSPLVLSLTIFALLVGIVVGFSSWLFLSIIVVGAVLTHLTRRSDKTRKSVVLFYELTPEVEPLYEDLLNATGAMASCAGVWHIEARGGIRDRKYHAGASNLVRRQSTRIFQGAPPYLETNIATAAIGVGRQMLYFLPDRVLIFGPEGVGAVGYRELSLTIRPLRFIEEGAVPGDTQVVDQTWQYVNKSGGPDRRFKYNRQFPVCLYEELHFASASGLNEVIQLSCPGAGNGIASALRHLATVLPG